MSRPRITISLSLDAVYLKISVSRVNWGGHRGHLSSSTVSNLSCKTLPKHSASPHCRQSAVPCGRRRRGAPGFKTWWPRYPSLSTANVTQSLRQRETVPDVCSHLPHSEMSTSPSSNRCPFKWQCPDNNPAITRRWILLKFCSVSSPVYRVKC
jgi:hypothetical protein